MKNSGSEIMRVISVVGDLLLLVEEWKAIKKREYSSPESLRAVEHYLVSWVKWMEEHCGMEFPIGELKESETRRWAERGAGTENTIKNKLSFVKAFIREMSLRGRIERTPELALMKGLKIARRERNVLTPEEIRDVWSNLTKKEGRSGREYMRKRVILGMLLLGMRLREITFLRWDEVLKGELRTRVKGGRKRSFPIDDELERNLLVWKERQGVATSWVMAMTRDKKPATGALVCAIKSMLKEAGVVRESYSGAHLWRHSVATILYTEHRNIREVKEYLGHSTVEVTERYIHMKGEEQMESLREIRKAIFKPRLVQERHGFPGKPEKL